MDQHYHKQYDNSNNLTGGGVDYNSGPYYLTFSAGVTSASFNVIINNDNVLEDNEEFNLIINAHSLPNNIITAGHHRARVIIRNDDGKFAIVNAVNT